MNEWVEKWFRKKLQRILKVDMEQAEKLGVMRSEVLATKDGGKSRAFNHGRHRSPAPHPQLTLAPLPCIVDPPLNVPSHPALTFGSSASPGLRSGIRILRLQPRLANSSFA